MELTARQCHEVLATVLFREHPLNLNDVTDLLDLNSWPKRVIIHEGILSLYNWQGKRHIDCSSPKI